jgi:hypothetical protein
VGSLWGHTTQTFAKAMLWSSDNNSSTAFSIDNAQSVRPP